MVLFIKYLLFVLLVIFVIGAAVFSLSSRRALNPQDKGLKRSVMNVMLGAMLVTLSLISMFLFRGSTVNIIVEAAFLLIGVFNIFSGLRSYSYYSRSRNQEQHQSKA
ncbi:YtpI family protein [Paenibacillus sp. FSL R5-0744]|uniref:YtpI family protein n=1 Tax=Paenibacillus sp. FSL R5-0744 TaxID=2921656 RepID=UPI0030DC26C2